MGEPKKFAIIVAGGMGTRMKSSIPKQFLPLMGLPVLCHSIMAFAHTYKDISITLVVPDDQANSASTILKSYLPNINNIKTVAGGATRFESVKNGLTTVDGDGIVFVHDGVRPLITAELIVRCYESALEHGSGVPALPVTDSIRSVGDDGETAAISRERLRVIQTPQTFRTDILLPAFEQPYNELFTDEASVVEAAGHKIYLVPGETENMKITNPNDMMIAETLLRNIL